MLLNFCRSLIISQSLELMNYVYACEKKKWSQQIQKVINSFGLRWFIFRIKIKLNIDVHFPWNFLFRSLCVVYVFLTHHFIFVDMLCCFNDTDPFTIYLNIYLLIFNHNIQFVTFTALIWSDINTIEIVFIQKPDTKSSYAVLMDFWRTFVVVICWYLWKLMAKVMEFHLFEQ